MKKFLPLLFALFFVPVLCWSQPTEQSFLSINSPTNCGTADNAVVSAATLFGGSTGFGCMKTLIFPQFSAGNGWTTQVTMMMPNQPNTAGLVTGTQPGFAYFLSVGSGATATVPTSTAPLSIYSASNGCMGLWSSNKQAAGRQGGDVAASGRADHYDFNSLALIGGCTGGQDSLVSGVGQGPMQVQVIAPNAAALQQATVQLTYFYQDATFSWQATVDPVDFGSAKRTWTAPLYQGGDYVTAFSVVNVSNTPQTVTVTLRDGTGGGLVTKTTPTIAAGCGCNTWQQSAPGGFYAATVGDFFPGIGTKTGSIQFDGNGGNIVVIVLRTIKGSLGSVPVK